MKTTENRLRDDLTERSEKESGNDMTAGLRNGRFHGRAEALDDACLRAWGHPHDRAIRQELLSALEWDDLRADVAEHEQRGRAASAEEDVSMTAGPS
jgi:hypothetical protein